MMYSMSAHEWRGESKVHDRVKELEAEVAERDARIADLTYHLKVEVDGNNHFIKQLFERDARIAQLEEALKSLLIMDEKYQNTMDGFEWALSEEQLNKINEVIGS